MQNEREKERKPTQGKQRFSPIGAASGTMGNVPQNRLPDDEEGNIHPWLLSPKAKVALGVVKSLALASFCTHVNG